MAKAKDNAGGGGGTLATALAWTQRQLRRVAGNSEALRHKVAQDSTVRTKLRGALGSGDYAAWLDRALVRDACRALDQQSPLFQGMIDSVVKHVIGTGLRPVGNGTRTPADNAAKMFCEWWDSIGNGPDCRNMDNGAQLQRMILRQSLVDGDLGIPLLAASDNRDQAVQIVESDLIVPKGGGSKAPDATDREGVIVDPATGAPTAFNVAGYSFSGAYVDDSKALPIPADRFIFFAHRKRSSQTRGISVLAVGADRLIGLDQYTDAVEVAAKIQAMFAIIIKTKSPQGARDALQTSTEDLTGSGNVTSLQQVNPGQMINLGMDEEFGAVQGSQPGTTFETFVRVMTEQVCAGLQFPYEVATNNMRGLNFSQARMAISMARETAAVIRERFIATVMQRLFEWRVNFLIARGDLPNDPAVFDIFWPPPPRMIVDPKAENDADVVAINNNLTTHKAVLAERGLDIDEVFRQRAEEKKRQDELGIAPVLMPGAKTPGAADAGAA
jgi:lambda family phage portal protein